MCFPALIHLIGRRPTSPPQHADHGKSIEKAARIKAKSIEKAATIEARNRYNEQLRRAILTLDSEKHRLETEKRDL
jgi:hypothetical protein